MGGYSTGEGAKVQGEASDQVPPGIPSMASYFGRMEAFNPNREEWLTHV